MINLLIFTGTFIGQELLSLQFITNLAHVDFQIYSAKAFICLLLSPLELSNGSLEDYNQLKYRTVFQFIARMSDLSV